MPLYEYECEACGLRFERIQHFSDTPLQTCPDCEGSVHRVIHPVGIIFKGSGFYVTDSRGKSSTLNTNSKTNKESKEAESQPEAPPASASTVSKAD
jgi:putative FmdB family regulatory protein